MSISAFPSGTRVSTRHVGHGSVLCVARPSRGSLTSISSRHPWQKVWPQAMLRGVLLVGSSAKASKQIEQSITFSIQAPAVSPVRETSNR